MIVFCCFCCCFFRNISHYYCYLEKSLSVFVFSFLVHRKSKLVLGGFWSGGSVGWLGRVMGWVLGCCGNVVFCFSFFSKKEVFSSFFHVLIFFIVFGFERR